MKRDVEEHRKVLQDLVRANGDISVLARQVEDFERWDVDPLVDLSALDVISILERFLRGELSADEVGIWAEALEMRDDVEFVDDSEIGVTTVVCWLANEAVGARPITPKDAREFVAELRVPPAPPATSST